MKIINMTDLGPVKDIYKDGHRDCSENLEKVISILFTKKNITKTTKVKVLVSDVVFSKTENPRRIDLPKIHNFSFLLRLYKTTFGFEFENDSYQERAKIKLEAYRMQGQKTMAWAGYGQYLYLEKKLKEEKELNSLPEDEREEARNKITGGDLIRIG